MGMTSRHTKCRPTYNDVEAVGMVFIGILTLVYLLCEVLSLLGH